MYTNTTSTYKYVYAPRITRQTAAQAILSMLIGCGSGGARATWTPGASGVPEASGRDDTLYAAMNAAASVECRHSALISADVRSAQSTQCARPTG